MSIIINNNIIFIDSLQLFKPSLDTLAGNSQDSDFKHLMSEFLEDKLKLFRKKRSISIWIYKRIYNKLVDAQISDKNNC